MKKASIEIIYEDSDILVINKPSGTSVTKDRSGRENLTDIFRRQLRTGAAELRLVHRLDKDASGVMILAKNVAAQRRLTGYFEKRLVKKTYLAIVRGIAGQAEGVIRAPLSAGGKTAQRMIIDHKKGKAAVTEWKLLADFGAISLLAVFPLTGRTHQIRLHLQSIGLPLAVDRLYGPDTAILLSEFKSDYRLGKNQIENPLIDRLTLHSYQLEFKETLPGVPDCFVAGLDKKFAAAIKMLSKYNPKGQGAFLQPQWQKDILAAKKIDIGW